MCGSIPCEAGMDKTGWFVAGAFAMLGMIYGDLLTGRLILWLLDRR